MVDADPPRRGAEDVQCGRAVGARAPGRAHPGRFESAFVGSRPADDLRAHLNAPVVDLVDQAHLGLVRDLPTDELRYAIRLVYDRAELRVEPLKGVEGRLCNRVVLLDVVAQSVRILGGLVHRILRPLELVPGVHHLLVQT